MPFKKYKGDDKYHFRYYHLSNNHPFLVVLVLEEKIKNGKILISGFNLTTSQKMVSKKPTRFVLLETNPNPSDDSPSYLSVDLVKLKPSKLFSDPLTSWHLSKIDEKKIDELMNRKYKKSPQGLIRDQSLILFSRAQFELF